MPAGLNGIYFVFWREMKRFLQQRVRLLMSIIQPVIWLALMGNMMARLTDNPFTAQMLGVGSYLSFMTPGIMIMTSLFAGVHGGVSIIWDRRLGFLAKLLSAPIPRYAIAFGKVLALLLQALLQILIVITIARLLGVQFATGIGGVLCALLLCALFSGIMSSISLLLSASIRNPETLFAIVNFLTMPLMFTSNALFPAEAMPGWIQAIARFNPISFAVTPLRSLIIEGWSAILPGLGVLSVMLIIALILLALRFERGNML